MSEILSRTDVVRLAVILKASATESEVGFKVDGSDWQRGTVRRIHGDAADIREQYLRVTSSGFALEYDFKLSDLVAGWGEKFVFLGVCGE